MTRICFTGGLRPTFVINDYEILKSCFDVDVVEKPVKKLLSSEWLRYAFILAEKVKQSDLTFSWFAGWHSAFAVFFSKLFGKKSIVVAGGFDCASVPEIDYGAFSKKRFWKEGLAAKYVFENADRVLAVSEFTGNEILKRVKPGWLEVIYNGVDVEKFSSDTVRRENLVVTVSEIKWPNLKRKGIETFVKSAQLVPEASFVVIGKFKDDSIGYLRSIAPSNVEFTGFVSDETLVRWYQRAKVICQLSYYEAFGLAPAEGMACGCIPIVTGERAGLPEVVGDTGFYVPYGDPKATAKAIIKALNAPDESREDVRGRIVKIFSLDRRGEELIKLIRTLRESK